MSLVREYRSDLVYQLIQPPVSRLNWSRKVWSENAWLPTIWISVILAGPPSVMVKVRFTRLRSTGVVVETTSAPYKLRLMY